MLRNNKVYIIVLLVALFLLFIFFKSSLQQQNSHQRLTKVSPEKISPPPLKNEKLSPKQNKALADLAKTQYPVDENKATNEQSDEAFIIDCTEQAITHDQTVNIEENDGYINYIETLSQSSNTEDKLANQIHQFRDKSLNQLKQYLQLLTEQPMNKLIYSRVLQYCMTDFEESICNENLYHKAAIIDRDNAMLWHNIAAIKLKNNNIDGAIEELKEANKKGEYNNYYYELITFLEQNLKQNSDLNFQERLFISTGFAGANMSVILPNFKFCQDNFFSETKITDICYQTGKHLKDLSKSELPRLLGLNLLKLFYEFNKNDEMIKIISKNIKDTSPLYQSEKMQKSEALMFFDEQLARDWLNLSLKQGENIAVKQLIDDAILYSKNPNYNPCPAL